MQKRNIITWIHVIDYTEVLSKVFPSFSKERKDRRESLIKAISCAKLMRNNKGCLFYTILCDDLRKLGTDMRTVKDMLEKYPLFKWDGSHYSYQNKEAREYQATEHFRSVMDEITLMVNSPAKVYWRQEKARRGIFCLLSKAPPKPSDNNIVYSCTAKVDTEAVKSYIERNKELLDTNIMLSVLRALSIAKENQGMLSQDYFRGNCGRLFSNGPESLQNAPKMIRSVAFKGCFEYDFVNAHYTLASHFTTSEHIQDYADNANVLRLMIAEDIDVEIGDVKAGLLMIICGVGRTLRVDSSLVSLFGRDKAREFLNHNRVKNIIEGVDQLQIDLKEGGYIPSDSDKSIGSLMSNFLMSQEAIVLDACIAEVKPELLLFDGFISREDKAPEYFEEIIQRETGFGIRVSKKRL